MNTDLPLTMAGPIALNRSSWKTRCENAAQKRLRAAVNAGHRLAVGLLDVVFQGDRSGPDVGAYLHRVLGAPAAQLGEVEAIADAADEVASRDFEAFFVLEKREPFFDNLERQAEESGEIQPDHAAAHVQRSQNQIVEEAEAEPRLLKVLRRGGASGRQAPSHSRATFSLARIICGTR